MLVFAVTTGTILATKFKLGRSRDKTWVT